MPLVAGEGPVGSSSAPRASLRARRSDAVNEFASALHNDRSGQRWVWFIAPALHSIQAYTTVAWEVDDFASALHNNRSGQRWVWFIAPALHSIQAYTTVAWEVDDFASALHNNRSGQRWGVVYCSCTAFHTSIHNCSMGGRRLCERPPQQPVWAKVGVVYCSCTAFHRSIHNCSMGGRRLCERPPHNRSGQRWVRVLAAALHCGSCMQAYTDRHMKGWACG